MYPLLLAALIYKADAKAQDWAKPRAIEGIYLMWGDTVSNPTATQFSFGSVAIIREKNSYRGIGTLIRERIKGEKLSKPLEVIDTPVTAFADGSLVAQVVERGSGGFVTQDKAILISRQQLGGELLPSWKRLSLERSRIDAFSLSNHPEGIYDLEGNVGAYPLVGRLALVGTGAKTADAGGELIVIRISVDQTQVSRSLSFTTTALLSTEGKVSIHETQQDSRQLKGSGSCMAGQCELQIEIDDKANPMVVGSTQYIQVMNIRANSAVMR